MSLDLAPQACAKPARSLPAHWTGSVGNITCTTMIVLREDERKLVPIVSCMKMRALIYAPNIT